MLQYLGIYKDVIENEVEKCCDIFKEAAEILDDLGYDENRIAEFVDIRSGFESMVIDRLQECGGNWADITNSIISASYQITEELINDIDVFKDYGIKLTSHVDREDSQLYINLNGERISECYFGKLIDVVTEVQKEYAQPVEEADTKEWVKENTRKWINEEAAKHLGEVIPAVLERREVEIVTVESGKKLPWSFDLQFRIFPTNEPFLFTIEAINGDSFINEFEKFAEHFNADKYAEELIKKSEFGSTEPVSTAIEIKRFLKSVTKSLAGEEHADDKIKDKFYDRLETDVSEKEKPKKRRDDFER